MNDNGQGMDADIAQLQKELLEARKASADARKALLDAERELASAQKPQLSDLQSRKAVVDAQKALLDAQNQAAVAHYIGDVKPGPYAGSVTLKEKAGNDEALLLAAFAVKEAARLVAGAVAGDADAFFIFSASQPPTFNHLLGFRYRVDILRKALGAASPASASSPGDDTAGGVTKARFISPGTVSAGLAAASNILSFFKTDYEIAGIDAKLDDSVLLISVAGALRAFDAPKRAYLGTLAAASAGDARTAVMHDLSELADLRTAAAARCAALSPQASDGDGAEQNLRSRTSGAAGSSKFFLAQLTAAIELYDSFIEALTTPDADGAIPLTTISQEWMLEHALTGDAALLLLRLENSGASSLLKRNIFTGFGPPPLYYTGGATVAYALFKGTEYEVIRADTIPVYSGFVKASDLRSTLQATPDGETLEDENRRLRGVVADQATDIEALKNAAEDR